MYVPRDRGISAKASPHLPQKTEISNVKCLCLSILTATLSAGGRQLWFGRAGTAALERENATRLTDHGDGIDLEPPVVHETQQLNVDDHLVRGDTTDQRKAREDERGPAGGKCKM